MFKRYHCGGTCQTRNPLAVHSPLRSMLLFRPAPTVLGMSEQAKAEWALAIARRDIPAVESRVAAYCAALGAANRIPGPMRRFHQAQAFRQINMARAQLRAARKALLAAELAMLAFAPGVGRLTHCGTVYGRCRHLCRADPGRTARARHPLFARA